MSEAPGPTLLKRVEAPLLQATRGVAWLGGVALMAMALATVYSILGRALPDLPGLAWWHPIRGNFELVELGTAFAIFSFLPYTHMVRGNVLVDFFTARAHPRVKAALAIPANALLTAMVALITWRMTVATIELQTATYTQTTMLLGVPLWWGYVPATAFMWLYLLVGAFTTWRSIEETRHEGEPVAP